LRCIATFGVCSLLLAGCQSLGAISGAVAAVSAGGATANPAVGIAVGVVVQAGTDEAVHYATRTLHQDQQDAIATIVGIAQPGVKYAWENHNVIPVDNGHGQVMVTRVMTTALATCKEFAFSVADDDAKDTPHESWFTASACQQNGHWKWASAEPAVSRWGNLQ